MSEDRSEQHAERHMMVTLGIAGVIVLSLGVGFVAGYVVGGGRSLQATSPVVPSPGMATADASHAEVSVRVETPRVETGKIEPVAPAEPAKSESVPELRRSAD